MAACYQLSAPKQPPRSGPVQRYNPVRWAAPAVTLSLLLDVSQINDLIAGCPAGPSERGPPAGLFGFPPVSSAAFTSAMAPPIWPASDLPIWHCRHAEVNPT